MNKTYVAIERNVNSYMRKKFAPHELQCSAELLREVRNAINGIVAGAISVSGNSLHKNSITWITDQLFKGIKLSNDMCVGDIVFIHEYELEELPQEDIAYMRELLTGTKLSQLINLHFEGQNNEVEQRTDI